MRRLMLTLSSTWIFVLSYYLKRIATESLTGAYMVLQIVQQYFQMYTFRGALLIMGTIMMLVVPTVIIKAKKEDTFSKARLIELVDSSFVPAYLGYFFVSLSVSTYSAMWAFYILVSVFVYFSGAEYFNPIFLLLKYHFYKVESENGVQAIIIYKSKSVIRKSEQLNDLQLYRINNLTYIGGK